MRRDLLKNNRGAALVSIMVAVAFVTILATAILSMSYNNFRMKVVNYESKANFYETEQRLTMVSTTLRNKVMSSTTPLSELKTLTGVPEVNGDRYRADSVAKLAFPSSNPSGADSASVTGPNGDTFKFEAQPGANYEETDMGAGLTKITLKGVKITQTESVTMNTNTIKTDVVMYIRESDAPAAMGGIGEFSVLSDAPLSTDSVTGTRINMFGNAFFMGMNFTGSETKPGSGNQSALILSGNCVYNVLGDYNFAYGDIVLNNNAALNIIGGSLTVYGNIYLNDNSTLTCTGKLYMPCAEKGAYGVTCASLDPADQVYPADLLNDIIRIDEDKCNNLLTALGLDDATPDNDGITAQIFASQSEVGNASGTAYYFDDTTILPDAEEFTTGAVTINGVSYYTRFFNKNEANGILKNQLVFLGSEVKIVESNENATLISKAPIAFAQVHSVNLSKMGSYAFNYLTLTEANEKDNYKYVESVHEVSMKDGKTFCVGEFLDPDANDTVKAIMGYAVNGSGGVPNYSSAIGYENWSKE